MTGEPYKGFAPPVSKKNVHNYWCYRYYSIYGIYNNYINLNRYEELLRKMGEKGESYDAIIRKLLHEANWKVLDERWNTILHNDEFIPLDAL